VPTRRSSAPRWTRWAGGERRGVAERDGFFVELRELWQAGRAVGMNQQTFAIVK
jgi:hypothetical protein